jgi:hypothetical protein
MTIRSKLTTMAIALSVFIGPAQVCFAEDKVPASTDKDADNLSRKMRFGNREIDLPLRLENDELLLELHTSENHTAQLEGMETDAIKLSIDRFLVDQDKAAIATANSFAQVWSSKPSITSLSIDKT